MICDQCEETAVYHITDLGKAAPEEKHLCQSHVREELVAQSCDEPLEPTSSQVALDIATLVRFAAQQITQDSDDVIEALKRLLVDENPNVRWVACVVLAKIGPKAISAAPLLSKLSQDDEVREAALWALSRIEAGGRP